MIRGLVLIFMWMAAIGGIILLISYAMKLNWIFDGIKGKFKKEDPLDRLQNAIDAQRINLTMAKRSVQASEEWVRQVQRERDRAQQDAQRLQSRIETALADKNEGDARNFTERLLAEESELKDCEERLVEAKSQHHEAQKSVDQFEREIRRMESKAKQLKIKSNLAEARQEAAAFMAEINTGIGEGGFQEATNELQEQIDTAEAKAKANERVASFVKDDDEYMEAASGSVEERLAQIKKKVQS